MSEWSRLCTPGLQGCRRRAQCPQCRGQLTATSLSYFYILSVLGDSRIAAMRWGRRKWQQTLQVEERKLQKHCISRCTFLCFTDKQGHAADG